MPHMLGFDIDGIIADSVSALAKVILAEFNIDINGKVSSYDFWEDPEFKEAGLTRERVMGCFNEAVMTWAPNGFTPVRAHDGARRLIEWCWQITGEPLHFVTTRELVTAEMTFRWLRKVCGEIPFSLSMVESKEQVVVSSFEWFVEDRLETAFSLAGKGVKVIMPVRSYNRSDSGLPEGVYEVKNLGEIPKLVLKGGSSSLRRRLRGIPRRVAV